MSTQITGIFGGSFNPIHNGHIAIANAACRSGMIDELWLMVSPQNPLKRNCELMDDEFRLHLAQIATREYSNIHVSDFEFHLPRPSYTYNTLERLRENYPERQFVIVIGADNWVNFSQWYKAKYLLTHYNFIIYPRKGYTISHKTLPSNVYYLDMPLHNISSTEIRKRIKENKNLSGLVNSDVEKELKSFLSKPQHK